MTLDCPVLRGQCSDSMHKTRLGHCKIIYGALPAHGGTVVGQDLDEIFEIADRIAVISRGELSEAYPAHAIDRERIGLLMAWAHEAGAATS